ncbi:MAG: methionyl-tRNA formyltransferase [Actinobacteria bacterium]|nr:methionyl-tRNA formyltransferase [Actinomycetota bacterium]
MRVVFMGTPAFAIPSLEALVRAHEVLLVVTRPDRAGGRGSVPRPSEVKQSALSLGLEVCQPESLRGETAERLRKIGPDVICVTAFGMVLPSEVLEVPRLGCLNVHASLLPRYRGAAPVQRAILDRETTTGVSIMRMEEGLDTGPYAKQIAVEIGDRTASELEDALARVGAEALLEVLGGLESGAVVWTAQDSDEATYAPKVTKDDVALSPDLAVDDALARVRASTRRAPARVCVGDRELTVLNVAHATTSIAPGGVRIESGRLVLGLRDGAIELVTVRPAGRGDMAGADWARGVHLGEDVCWRCTR